MKKRIQQFRYYGEGYADNNVFKDNLISGSAFPDSIVALGIQTYPGIKFYLNGSEDPVVIGSSGIFEIDIRDNCEITLLSFDESSINFIEDRSNSAYLIIDVISNVEE